MRERVQGSVVATVGTLSLPGLKRQGGGPIIRTYRERSNREGSLAAAGELWLLVDPAALSFPAGIHPALRLARSD